MANRHCTRLLGIQLVSDSGVPQGTLLARFAESATHGSEDLADVRAELLAAIGPTAFIEAASTVGAFNGLVRTADAIGIPLDDGMRNASVDFRSMLGLNLVPGAKNTDLAAAKPERESDPARLFR